MAQTSRYGLPLLDAGQAQKEITHNEAIARIGTLLHLSVESRRTATPLATIDLNWIIPAGAAGVWAGQDNAIATLDEAGWTFTQPSDGCIAFIRDEAAYVHFAKGQWQNAWPVPALTIGGSTAMVSGATGGTVVDAEARATLAQLLMALSKTGLVTIA